MRLTVLGCAGSEPGPNAACSGYLVEAEGFLLGLELGNGALAQMRVSHDPFDLGGLMFSHLHPDHCADVAGLIVMRRYRPPTDMDARLPRLPVYAPANAPSRFAGLYAPTEEFRLSADFSDVFDFHPLANETLRIGPFEVQVIGVRHGGLAAFGFRISHGNKTLAYTGDTGDCVELDELARDADILLAEASWPDRPGLPKGLHLTGRQAGALAKRTNPRRLLLTHIVSAEDKAAVLAEARAEFAETELVSQGAVYEL